MIPTITTQVFEQSMMNHCFVFVMDILIPEVHIICYMQSCISPDYVSFIHCLMKANGSTCGDSTIPKEFMINTPGAFIFLIGELE